MNRDEIKYMIATAEDSIKLLKAFVSVEQGDLTINEALKASEDSLDMLYTMLGQL